MKKLVKNSVLILASLFFEVHPFDQGTKIRWF